MATLDPDAAASSTGDNEEKAPALAPPTSVAHKNTSDALVELVRLSMQLRFDAGASTPKSRLAMLQAAQRKTRQAACDMLADADSDDDSDAASSRSESAHAPLIDALLAVAVTPPSAFFVFRGNGRMHLPLIDWSAFRGYSMAFWIHVDRLPTTKADEVASFDLYRFTNAAYTLGVDATLEIDGDYNASITVRSCAPHSAGSEHKRNNFGAAVVAAIAPTVTTAPSSPDWKPVTHRVQLRKRQWQLLVITHSLHYVKKSRVTCYVDAQPQFSEELMYPSGLVHATKATLGGGSNAVARIASATMYHEELSKSVIETIGLQGPTPSLFQRFLAVPTGATAQHMADLRESVVPSPFSGPTDAAVARMGAFSKLQVVFSFHARDEISGHDDVYADRSVEWISEGVTGAHGKWLSLEQVQSTSEIQQRNARLGKNVHKGTVTRRETKAAWGRLLGVDAVPVLLDYLLTATENLMKEFSALDDSETIGVLRTTVESLTTDLLCLFRGLLLNHVTNIHQALKTFLLHQFYYVVRRHSAVIPSAWTPTNIVACVDMITSMLHMTPSSLSLEDGRSANHPTQPSVWSWNPIFASAVRAWLLDFRVWAKLSFKTQSIFNHQLYRLACEHPKLLNDLDSVSRLLETLQLYFDMPKSNGNPNKDKPRGSSVSAQKSNHSAGADKEQHWKQQCIQTIIETLEVCLVNQSVHVHAALEQEVLETTFARAAVTATTPSAASTPGSSTSSNPTAEIPGLAGGGVAFSQRRKGGVFFMNLENIIWSDQPSAASSSSASEHHRGGPLDSDDKQDGGGVPSVASSALPHVQIRFSLLRDLRSIVRFVVVCEDPQVCGALLQLIRRLSVAYLDLRFGFISSNVVDAVLRVLSVFARPPQYARRNKERRSELMAQAAEVRMACVPLLIYYLEWLESVEGRTVWCGLEEHLRSVLNGDGNYTRGFLELMMEFYFDPIGRCGVQQSIVMNDPSKKDSVLFPLSPAHSSKAHNSSMHDTGIVAMSDDSFRTDGMDAVSRGSGGSGLGAWIKLATSFCGKKLSLSWEKRVQIVRMAALRSLSQTSHSSAAPPSSDGGERSPPRHTQQEVGVRTATEEVMRVYDKGVIEILSLPLKSILPFLPALLVNTSVHMRDRVLMEISVKLKTDDAHHDHQILMMKRDWIEALLELCVVCNNGSQRAELPSVDTVTPPNSNDRRTAYRSTAFSFDAHKTGEDLVVDAMVSLLCSAMQHPSGWRAFVDLIAALKVMQRKYSPQQSTGDAESASYIPPVLADLKDAANGLLLLAHPLDWLGQITGIVLQKMARSRTILSKVLTENVRKILVLVQEALLFTAHEHCPAPSLGEGDLVTQQRASGRYVWSEAQVSLLTAVLDMCVRLVDSTHKAYRCGLVPGLHILQASLSYVPADGTALVARITQTMERAFQQELNTSSAVRVYDHLTPREVFLSALVCLRRALLVQQGNGSGDESELCDALQLLILKLCTSEIFLEDLHSCGLTVHDLSEMSEESAVAAVLDALGVAMNDVEMHEREEEADLVPLFPDAKELRRLDEGEDSQDQELDPDPFAIAFASTDLAAAEQEQATIVAAFDDQLERSVWAALEVEENRMLESLKDVAQRESKRQDRIREVAVPDRDTWTARLWDVQEYKFRSQHARSLLSREVSASIMKEFARRVGAYESPVPGRLRKPLDPDFPMTNCLITAVEEDEDLHLHAADLMRRRFSLPLEMHGLSEGRLVSSDSFVADTEASSEDEAHRLLERVGREVAAQGGGEIQDITAERVVHLEGGAVSSLDGDEERGANQSVGEEGPDSPTKGEYEPHTRTENNDGDQQERAEEERKPSSLQSPALPSGLWHVDTERHSESGLDPSEGIALATGEQIVAQATCRRVLPEGMVHGRLYFCAKVLVFVPLTSAELEASGTPSANDEVAPGLRRCWRWKYKHIAAVFLRRFRLRDSALELFFQNGSTHFLDFPHVVKQQRNELVRLLYSFVPRNVLKQWPGRAAAMSSTSLAATTKAWQHRQISNYEYLMALNTYAGRSFNDLTQYPVFPWVVRDYESPVLDLNDPETFRDLSKPMGALNPDRLQEFWERYNSFDDPVIPKFLYGSHYSTCAGVVLFFLVRMQPFAQLHKKMQGGTFDLPDRLFYSIQETWHMCNSQMSEVKELTPEFYSDPSFLTNGNSFAFGKRHDHLPVHDVMLPPWANGSPEEFVRLHRAALESEYVSQHLHEWVDLIFGFKQRGKAALKANNVFYYLTYYGVVDLDRIEDPFIRESMELQIAHFGQCPMQLFSNPHPRRNQTTRRVPGAGGPSSSASSPAPGVVSTTPAPQATLASPGVWAPAVVSPSTTPGTSLAKPLSWMFQDISPSAQEHRRHWSPTLVVKPFAASAVRWIKIFPDRFLTVNELGVVELHYWKLSPKPLPLASETPGVTSEVPETTSEIPGTTSSTNTNEEVVLMDGPGTPAPLPERASEYEQPDMEVPLIPVTVRATSVVSATAPVIEPPVEDAGAEPLLPSGPTCPWLIEVARDDSPFDIVPRIPVFEDNTSTVLDAFFPITASLNGRVLISGGAPNGSIQLRLLDLDNGHVIAKASVTGHDAAVTCLSVDRFSYHNAPVGSYHQSDGDELLVSGAKDATLAVWRLSRTKPDLLFRPPRISTCPLMVLRGHKLPLVDCAVNTYLDVVASCSTQDALVHFLHDDGAVAFGLNAGDIHQGSSFVNIAASMKGFIVALARWVEGDTATTSSACVVVNLAGVVVLKQVFENEIVSRLQLSSEGDLVVLTMADQGILRLCRLDDFAVVQEYETSSHVDAPICVASFGPDEATFLAITGHADGSMVIHLLPDADGSVSLLANLRRLLGVSSKLKMVKGTVQHAQNLAWTTLGNAKAVTTTARDIAGEAIGEAKSIVKGFISYLRQSSGSGPP